MKTTIDLPEDLISRAEAVAAKRKTTLTDLVAAGLNLVLRPEAEQGARERALKRLEQGLDLGGRPLTRDEAHERVSVL